MKVKIIRFIGLLLTFNIFLFSMAGCQILKPQSKKVVSYKNVTKKKIVTEFVPDEDADEVAEEENEDLTEKDNYSESSNGFGSSKSDSGLDNVSDISGKKYYVSNNGSDDNDGLTPETPWKTIDKVNSALLFDDDSVLFERGSEWRGKTVECAPGVNYGAYGSGENPILNGSVKNYSEKNLWILTDTPNIYKYSVPFDSTVDVGNLVFDNGKKCAIRMRNGIYELNEDLSYYYNTDSCIYLRSDYGNPADRFSSIEVVTDLHLMRAKKLNTVENITFKYGNYGFTTSDATVYAVNNINIRNCKFEWIGGCICGTDDSLRLGNAIEFWGSCSKITVENCEFSQIFDTAITTQFTNKAVVDNVNIINNKIDKCHWGMEFWLQGEGSTMSNVTVQGNTISNCGMGWSANQRWASLLIHSAAISDLGYYNFERTGIVIKDNIFNLSAGSLLKLSGSNWSPTISGNTYIQKKDASFGYVFDRNYTFNDSLIKHALLKIDETAKASFYEESD